jgi:hypothetical protein
MHPRNKSRRGLENYCLLSEEQQRKEPKIDVTNNKSRVGLGFYALK